MSPHTPARARQYSPYHGLQIQPALSNQSQFACNYDHGKPYAKAK
ncbi:Uncharacterised protein [Vibrio cholerae]|nr:Uncharacterised protein [Vibrio cholerae]CSI81565.1 Uncharacterised protein [Vibrio cholerae]